MKQVLHKLSVVVLVWALLAGFAVPVAAKTFNARFPAELLAERVKRIARESGASIMADRAAIGATRVQALTANGLTAAGALRRSLEGTAFGFKQTSANAFVVVRAATAPTAQKKKVVAGSGSLKGTVLDANDQPVIGAAIRIEGTRLGAASGVDGSFTIAGVPAGTYTVEVSCLSYAKMKVSDVKVLPGKATPLDVVMQEDAHQLQGVTVTATYNKASATGLYAKQKSMVAMSDGISADMIKKTGDNNVAQVLGRVAGVTIESGKFVTVRGMGERYNNVELNGATLPSTEPNRRNFSFDVIPSALVDNVTVTKTFTPDLPGEFTGGLVQVNTLAVPEERFLSVSLGTGLNTNSTGKDFYSAKRYGSDYFFGNTSDRSWYAGQDKEATKQSIVNAGQKDSYGLRLFKAAPMQNYSLTVGQPFVLPGGQKLGLVMALTYRNEQTHETINDLHFITGDTLIRPGGRYRFVTTTGAVANVGWQMPGHKLTWRNLFNNRFSNTAMQRYIFKQYEGYQFVDQYNSPMQSRVVQTQVDGEHHLFNDNLVVTWNGSYNQTLRTTPDERYAVGGYILEPDGREYYSGWYSAGKGMSMSDGFIMYGKLNENKKNVGINLSHPFVVAGNKQQLKAGYMGTFRHARYDQIYLKPDSRVYPGWAAEQAGSPVDRFFSPENFAKGYITFVSSMDEPQADFYTGTQTVNAAYIMGEFTFLRKLHLTTGVRMEHGRTQTSTRFFNGTDYRDSVVTQRKTDWLPAATLIYNITDNINARAAYSTTIARPDFRELTNCTYYNVDDRVEVWNFQPVKQTYIHNYDLRLEWYPQPGEVVSLSAFYKRFKNPVELLTWAPSPQDVDFYNYNLEKSTAKGLELNVRKSLGFVAPACQWLSHIYFNANATVLKGDVTYNLDKLMSSAGEVYRPDRKRPLQGLAPYTVNAGLAYNGAVISASANYARSGRKLMMAGEREQFDQYEAPRDVLDLQLSAKLLHRHLELKFNVSDLLNQDIVVYRNCVPGKGGMAGDPEDARLDDMDYNPGDWVMSRMKKGVNFSVSAAYKF